MNNPTVKILTPDKIQLGQPLEKLGFDHQLGAFLGPLFMALCSKLGCTIDRLLHKGGLKMSDDMPYKLFIRRLLLS